MKDKNLLKNKQLLKINGAVAQWTPTKGDTRWGKEYIGWVYWSNGMGKTYYDMDEIESIEIPTAEEVEAFNWHDKAHAKSMTEYYSSAGYKGD